MTTELLTLPPLCAATVEEHSPGPYLEIFARRKRHGWASWGNEIANDVEMPNGMDEGRRTQGSANTTDDL